jgi:hypothetical protein
MKVSQKQRFKLIAINRALSRFGILASVLFPVLVKARDQSLITAGERLK